MNTINIHAVTGIDAGEIIEDALSNGALYWHRTITVRHNGQTMALTLFSDESDTSLGVDTGDAYEADRWCMVASEENARCDELERDLADARNAHLDSLKDVNLVREALGVSVGTVSGEELVDKIREREQALAAQLKSCKREIAALSSSLNKEDVSHSNTIDQRDYAEKMADNLSFAIIGITGRDIGEHSSANSPWSNALEHAEEYEYERGEGIEREQALVAHMERLQSALRDILLLVENDLVLVPEGAGDMDECFEECYAALYESPTTHLSRREAEGMKKAATLIEKKASDYDAEHGTTDPSTGHREYPGDGAEYYNELMELADELRRQAEGANNA